MRAGSANTPRRSRATRALERPIGVGATGRKASEQRGPKRGSGFMTQSHQRAQIGGGTRPRALRRGGPGEQMRCHSVPDPDLIANGDADPGFVAAGAPEDSKRQVLNGEVRLGSVGGVSPSFCRDGSCVRSAGTCGAFERR